MTVKRRNRRC